MEIYLGLGSNQGDRRAALTTALDALEQCGVRVSHISPLVESPALLPDGAPKEWNLPFLNVVAACDTDHAPERVLELGKRIEVELGRNNCERWSPRPVDIDILLWGNEQISTEAITIPHPSLHERNFVLTPLIALDPRLTIPGLGTNTVLEWSLKLKQHIPLWMGIVNITPDSFSDGGEFLHWEQVDAQVERMVDAGGQIIDLGAESTRPGALPLRADDEWSRLAPILEQLIDKYRNHRIRPRVSVDTYHTDTARRALALGADIVNDVGGLASPDMLELASSSSADWVAMHQLSLPADPARVLPADCDPSAAVEQWLERQLESWERAGIDLHRIIFDPGIGFGKDALQSLRLLRDVGRFRRHGVRCLVGHSRKSFLTPMVQNDQLSKDMATVGASMQLAAQGVDILRVHDVPANIAAYNGWAHLAPM